MPKLYLQEVAFKELIFDIIEQLPITAAQKSAIENFLVSKYG